MTANGYMVSYHGDENVLQLDSDDGCTTLWVENPLNCTLFWPEFYGMDIVSPQNMNFKNSQFEIFYDHHWDANFSHGLVVAFPKDGLLTPLIYWASRQLSP